jgi:HKD family nuclease
MQRFLHGEDIQKSVVDLIEKGERVDLAVAYWGKGAIDRLNLKSVQGKIRILCDLLSGGCNPNEIKRLLELSDKDHIQILHLNRLHAKVYWTPTNVIVGSANASANGLGDEGELGTIEAALLTDDVATRSTAATWFDNMWKKGKKIDDTLLDQAKEAWLRRTPIPKPEETVLDVYLNDVERFRKKVWITYYFSEASAEAEKKFHEIKELHYSASQIAKFGDENIPMYDESLDHVSAEMVGDSVIDVTDGVFEILEVVPYSPYSKKRCIILLKPKNNVRGYRFPKEQRDLFKKAIEHHLANKEKNLGKLTDEEKDFACNMEDFSEKAGDAHQYLVKALAEK